MNLDVYRTFVTLAKTLSFSNTKDHIKTIKELKFYDLLESEFF